MLQSLLGEELKAIPKTFNASFFSFLPPSQETYEGKVTQLYSGFGYEQIVKMA